jgi:hypothetical protein
MRCSPSRSRGLYARRSGSRPPMTPRGGRSSDSCWISRGSVSSDASGLRANSCAFPKPPAAPRAAPERAEAQRLSPTRTGPRDAKTERQQ